MATFSNLFDLETLFIEKLQEKYKLNIRDIKRAFSKFDIDNNGLLDLAELVKGIQIFLNGVKESQVRELVSRYDLNGDGKISYEEFLSFLQSRTAVDMNEAENNSESPARYSEPYSPRPASNQGYSDRSRGYNREEYGVNARDYYGETSSRQSSNIPHEYAYKQNTMRAGQRHKEQATIREDVMSDIVPASDIRSTLDATNPRELEYRAKIFIQNLRNYLIKKAYDLRLSGKVKMPVTMKLEELQESVARGILTKLFQPFTGDGDGRARSRVEGVEFPDFARVLRSFAFPGTSPIRTETIQFLFDLCSHSSSGQMTNEEGRPVADASHFIELIFGQHLSRRQEVERKKRAVPAAAEEGVIDKEGLLLSNYVEKVEAGRRTVGYGPVNLPSATDAKAEKVADILAVPLRFVSRKSRTALTVPSNFDPNTAIPRSNSLPNYSLIRKHVFGLSTTHYSGNTLYTLPFVPDSFQDLRNQRGAINKLASPRSNPDFIDNAVIVYTSAALGIVHNLATNTQLFFDCHKDDISCLTVSNDGTLAATGCVGKAAVVHIWNTNTVQSEALVTIGPGPFERGVCALEFSWDNLYLIGIGCDDTHLLSIFDTRSGAKVAEMSSSNGIPPQIKWMRYCPGQQHTEYVTREHAGLCDLFATTGDHHIRLWSFRRPSKTETASLTYKGCTMGKSGASAAKVYTCCLFVYCEDKTYDLVAGGSNGVVYLWKRGVVASFAQVFRGRVQTMVLGGDRLYVGGVGGGLKVLDARTLSTIRAFNLLGVPAAVASSKRPASAAKPRASSATPASRAGSARPRTAGPALAGDAITVRKSNAPPQHAAGLSNRDREARENAFQAPTEPEEAESGSRLVTGIAVVPGVGRGSTQGTYLLVSLGTGKIVRVDVGNTGTVAETPRNQVAENYFGSDLLFFHTGPVYGLAADVSSSQRLFATVRDDKKLMIWDSKDRVLIGKTTLKNPSRTCHLDKTNSFVAVGSNAGTLTIYFLTDFMEKGGNFYRVDEVAFRKDCKSECTEVKFSPSNEKIVLGAHDDSIYVYGCELTLTPTGQGRNTNTLGSCVLRALHRLRGHSSAITHIDWSYDSKLLRSTCQAYELLCWDVETGKLSPQTNVADVRWKTHHCVLGFHVMGIWPLYSDGTDINAIDVSNEKGVVVTANDDGGLVRLFNYPCVVKNAPVKEYAGHSSHVTNIKFLRGGDTIVTSGGNDGSAMVFDVVRDTADDNGFR